jgi:tryptophan-rich sensory protein
MTDIGADHFQTRGISLPAERDILGAIGSAVLPPALFVGLNALAMQAGLVPSLPVPAFLSDGAGAAIFLLLYPSLGLAHWVAARHGEAGHNAARWALALLVLLLAYPFAMAAADVFGQAALTVVLFLLGLGTSIRLFKVSPLAGLLALPVLLWSGAGAFLGIAAISGGWTPPFGPTSDQPI